jgi:hypothetical protein
MNPPPCYQEMCKMVKTKNEQLEQATEQLEEAKVNESALIQQVKRITDASKVFQQAYLRVTTENAILEERIRKLEGRM